MRDVCFAPNCNSKRRKRNVKKDQEKEVIMKNLTLFSPRNIQTLEKWKKAIPRTDREMTLKDVVCELHFDKQSIVRYFEHKLKDGSTYKLERERPRLRSDAVPSIFSNLPCGFTNSKIRRISPIKGCSSTENSKKVKINLQEDSGNATDLSEHSCLQHEVIMQTYCCVPGCDSGKRSEKERSKEEGRKCKALFAPPKNDDLFEKWQIAILNTNKELTRKDPVCELHFHEDDIERFFITKLKDGSVSKIERERLLLKRGAIPSIFSNMSTCFTENLPESKLATAKNLATHDMKLEIEASHHSDKGYSTIKTSDNIQNTHGNFEYTKRNTDVNFLQQKENVYVNLEKTEGTCEIFLQNGNVSHMNDSFTYYKLLENLSRIQKPNHWWNIAPVANFLTCVRWNGQFTIDKRVVVEQDLNVKIFVKERQIIIMDLSKVNSIDEVSSILTKVESFGICTGASERSRSNCLVCLPSYVLGRRRIWCTNCQAERRRIVDRKRKSVGNKRENRIVHNASTNERLRQKLRCVSRQNTRKVLKIEQLKQIVENYKKMNSSIKKTATQKIICSFPHSQQESVQASVYTSRNS